MKFIFFVPYIALICLLASPAAKADVLFAGGEESDFIFTGTRPQISTSSSYRDTQYSRLAIGPYDYAYMKTHPFTPTTTFWSHFSHKSDSSTSGVNWVVFADNSGTQRLFIEIDDGGTTTAVHIYKVNAAGTETLLATSTELITMNSIGDFDVFVDYSVTGRVSFYENGKLIVDYTGDITTDGQTQLAQLWFTKAATASYYDSYYTQVIVATTDTRNAHLITLEPDAVGNAMNWAGAFTDIDETGLDHSDNISSDVTGELAQFTVPVPLPTGSYSAIAFVQNAWIRRSATGPQNVRFLVRTGGADYTSADVTLDTAYGFHSQIWNLNPAISANWTTGAINAAGFNMGVKSTN